MMSHPFRILLSDRKINDPSDGPMTNTAEKLLSGTNFHVDVAGGRSCLVSDDGDVRLRLDDLDTETLVRVKDLAHNQYLLAMMTESLELDVHRATLNHVCRAVERRGNPLDRPARPSRYARPAARRGGKFGRAA